MRIGMAKHEGEPALIMPMNGHWIDVTRAHQDSNHSVSDLDNRSIRTIQDLLDHGLFNEEFYKHMVDFVSEQEDPEAYLIAKEPRFMLPLRPGKIVAIGRNYKAHVEELNNEMPKEPLLFAKLPTACIGPGKPIIVKEWYGRVDHEGELAVVIGKRAKDVKAEDAREYIAGYTLINDVTAREMQMEDKSQGNPWFRSKNLDTFCPIGPVVVLRDTLPWPVKVDIKVTVNGEIRQHSNTEKWIFDLDTIIAYVTRFMTLEPGDLIATGTPEGVAPLNPGDEVEVSVPEIGVLRNPII